MVAYTLMLSLTQPVAVLHLIREDAEGVLAHDGDDAFAGDG
jgi:hypothetical protein